jgi:CBS domain-containing protein
MGSLPSESTPGMEFRIAAAGPLVTAIVVIVAAVIGGLVNGGHHFFAVATGQQGFHVTPAIVWLSWLASTNLLVLAFNLVPAFPLDGGRILHAIVWRVTGDQLKATRAAARCGMAFAILLGAGGLLLFFGGNAYGLWLGLLAMFIWTGAKGALMYSGQVESLRKVTVGEVMDRQPVTLPAHTTLIDAEEHWFARYDAPWIAVIDEEGHFLGVARRDRVGAELSQGRPALEVRDVVDPPAELSVSEDVTLEDAVEATGTAMARFGALIAVDRNGILQGVVTAAHVRRAVAPMGGPGGRS